MLKTIIAEANGNKIDVRNGWIVSTDEKTCYTGPDGFGTIHFPNNGYNSEVCYIDQSMDDFINDMKQTIVKKGKALDLVINNTTLDSKSDKANGIVLLTKNVKITSSNEDKIVQLFGDRFSGLYVLKPGADIELTSRYYYGGNSITESYSVSDNQAVTFTKKYKVVEFH